MNELDDEFFANGLVRKQAGEVRRKNKKQQKKADEQKAKSVGGKERWRYNPNHSYEDD
jgi:hypothetical protein